MICFSLATRTSTLLHRNLIPLSASQGRPTDEIQTFYSPLWERTEEARGVEEQPAWHHHRSPFITLSLSFSCFFLSPHKAQLVPSTWFSFSKESTFCYFLFYFFLSPSLEYSLQLCFHLYFLFSPLSRDQCSLSTFLRVEH